MLDSCPECGNNGGTTEPCGTCGKTSYVSQETTEAVEKLQTMKDNFEKSYGGKEKCPACNGTKIIDENIQGFRDPYPCPLCVKITDTERQQHDLDADIYWVRTGTWEGVAQIREKRIGFFNGNSIAPVPKDMVQVAQLSRDYFKGVKEKSQIVNALAQLFDVTDMSELDANDFKDKANEIFELVLQSREAVSNL